MTATIKFLSECKATYLDPHKETNIKYIFLSLAGQSQTVHQHNAITVMPLGLKKLGGVLQQLLRYLQQQTYHTSNSTNVTS